MREIHRADPSARRLALFALAVAALAGGALLVAAERYRAPIEAWLVADPSSAPSRLRIALLVLAALATVPLAGFAVRLWRLGTAVASARRFPPPGLRVVRDTPVVDGDAALRRARAMRIVAVLLAAGALALLLGFVRIAVLFA